MSRLLAQISGGRQPLPPGRAGLEVDRHQPQPLWDAEAELDQALPLPGLRTRLVDFEHPQAGGDRRPALHEGVQAGSEDDVLADAVTSLFHEQILAKGIPADEFRYRNALFHLLTAETSCYRYWGEGIWTAYGNELSRRTSDIANEAQ